MSICSSSLLQSGFNSEVLKIRKLLFYSFLLFTDFNNILNKKLNVYLCCRGIKTEIRVSDVESEVIK